MTAFTDPARLTRFGTEVLKSLAVPDADAELVSDSLVTADLWGHPSHGMLRLAWYATRLRTGVMTSTTHPQLVADDGPVAVLDGRDGIGQVITQAACQEAITRARAHGVSAVAVRNSNHFGTAAYWTRSMAEQQCLGILTTNGSPAMAPWGGTQKTVGANPWSIAAPAGDHPPVVLDIANTGVARGKIYAAAQRGEEIPESWALDEHGIPTTDPHAAVNGLLAPMGAHKGYGISFMMDVLSGVLSGSGVATEIAGPYVPDRRSRCGHLVIALHIGHFLPEDEFGQRMDHLIGLTKKVPRAAGVDEIFYPGEIEARSEASRRTTGVHLPDQTVADLRELGDSCGVPFDHLVLGISLVFTVFVTFTVRTDDVEEFTEALHANAQASLSDEPGCLRFDVHRSLDRANVFLLYEIYADEDAFYVDHRGAPHYAAWRDVVARCVPDGGLVNVFGTPAFPADIPEAVSTSGGH